MLSPDLLDRRAIALIRLVDPYGRPVDGPVRIEGEGVRTVAKGAGRFALVAAKGMDEYTAAFEEPPAQAPVALTLDLTPAETGVAPRRFVLALPRDPDPANAQSPTSLFQPAEVAMLPSARIRLTGSACAVRVTVCRKDDGRLVENALVRARSDDLPLEARAVTDHRGEACLLFPSLPLAFAGPAASVRPDMSAKVVVHADPASAHFHEAADPAASAQATRTVGHADPDAIAAAFPADFTSGAAVQLAAGRQLSLSILWE
jgi:hypothetical protein